MIAVVIGATGLVGSQVLANLVADDSFDKVIVVSRRPLEIESKKIQEVIIENLSDLKRHKRLLHGDCYFCTLGTTIKAAASRESFRKVDYHGIIEFAVIAKEFEAKSFVTASALGANSKSKIFYNRVKGETENALLALGFKHLVIFRPALLIGERTESRPGEAIARGLTKLLAPFIPHRFLKKVATSSSALAAHMVQEAKHVKEGTHIIEAAEIKDP